MLVAYIYVAYKIIGTVYIGYCIRKLLPLSYEQSSLWKCNICQWLEIEYGFIVTVSLLWKHLACT